MSKSDVTVDEETGIKHYDPSATGTLRFAPGESSKTIDVSGIGFSRSYKILLSDNEGNATLVGGIKEATLKILIKDTASRTKNLR